jgi:hypothetical protein
MTDVPLWLKVAVLLGMTEGKTARRWNLRAWRAVKALYRAHYQQRQRQWWRVGLG